VDCTKEPIPVVPTAHYQNGGIPTNYLTRVIKGDMEKETLVEGYFAVGECSAASVHGANRLGTNSLLDLVVFGRTAGREVIKYVEEHNFVDLAENAGSEGIAQLQKYANANGTNTFGPVWNELTHIMHTKVGVFRTEELMAEAIQELDALEAKMDDFRVVDKSSIYNLDLIEAIELENMIICAKMAAHAAILRKESRGGHYRDDYPERDDVNFLKHTEATLEEDGKTPKISYRKVRMQPLTVEPFPPKARVY
jgi:succinate dehydrogenase / fumarate reductase flavoprotein subunit